MKALSLKNPWAGWIYYGQKTIETRNWKTNYRGDLLICCSKTFDKNAMEGKFDPKCYVRGQAICVVELWSVEEMNINDQFDAMCSVYLGAYAWHLKNVRKIEPVPVKGKLGLFNVPKGTVIKYI